MKNVMKKIRRFMFVVVLLLSSLVVVSCFNETNNDRGSHDGSTTIIREIYRVQFVVDGIQYRYMDVSNFQVFTPPEIPEKENFEIIGWTNENGELHDFSEPVNRPITFFAKYQADYLAITNELSKTIISSNVKILVTTYNTGFLGIGKKDVEYSQGSGIIIHDQHGYYYVLTNEHVTTKGNKKYADYKIIDYKGKEYTGGLHKNTEQAFYDLSVLYFKKGEEELHVTKLAQVNPTQGEEVIAIGQPHGQNNTITFGEVAEYRKISLTNGFNPTFRALRHTAPTGSGSSGGALLNMSFNLVGLHFAGTDTLHYAIPIEIIIVYLNEYVYVKS